MSKLLVKFRTWYKGIKPRPIKLKIGQEGWAGESHEYKDGAKPQPWHCLPFVEGSTYGLELIYPFDTECEVVNNNGKIEFTGNFEAEKPNNDIKWPPFQTFAPNHYGFTSSLDLQVPSGYVVRLEPHPKYFTDITYTTPCVVPGHLQTEWWTRVFFIVFKTPPLNGRHIFRKLEPYAQILIVPKRVDYEIIPMTKEEINQRHRLERIIDKADNFIAKKKWIDDSGHYFNDKYKILSSIFAKSGIQGVEKFLDNCYTDCYSQKEKEHKIVTNRMKRRLVPFNRNETL